MNKNSFVDFLIHPPPSLKGVVGVLGVGIMGNLAAAILQIALQNNALFLLVAIFSIALFLVASFYLWRMPPPIPTRTVTTPKMRPIGCKGLILLVGPGRKDLPPESQSASRAIEYHLTNESGDRLRVCWIVTSPEGAQYADDLKQQFAGRGVEFPSSGTVDALQAIFTKECVRGILNNEIQKFGLIPDEVITDITGGTKPMSVGAMMACGETNRMQYFLGDKEIYKSEPILVKFDQPPA